MITRHLLRPRSLVAGSSAVACAWLTLAPLLAATGALGAEQPVTAALPGMWTTVANGDRINALEADGDVAWSATAGGGAVRWNLTTGEHRQYLAPQDGLPSNDVRAFVRTPAGELYAATARGLARFDESRQSWGLVSTAGADVGAESVTALAVSPSGMLWVGFEQRWDPAAIAAGASQVGAFVGGGIATYDPIGGRWGVVERARPTDRLGESYETIPSDNVTALAVAPDGTLWVGTRPYFVWSRGSTAPGSADGAWLRRGGGLAATDGARWRQWRPSGAAATCTAEQINALAVDAAGRVWAATAGRGLQAFRSGIATGACSAEAGHSVYMPWRGAGTPGGIAGTFVWSVAGGDDGRIWAGVGAGYQDGLGVSVLDHRETFESSERPWESDDVWATYGLDDRVAPADAVVSAIALRDDGFLAGTRELGNGGDGWGVKRRAADGTWSTYTTSVRGLPGNRITALAASPDGRIWVGTEGRGLAVWDGASWRGSRAFGRADAVATTRDSAVPGATAVVVDVAPKELSDALGGPRPRLRLGADPTLYEMTTARAVEGGTEMTLTPGLLVPASSGTRVYGVERGPASDTVSAVAVDEEGRAWVGGRRTIWLGRCPTYPRCWLDGGLTMLDAAGWHGPFDAPNDQALGDVQALAAVPGGDVWVGTSNPNQGTSISLATYRPATGEWRIHLPEDGAELGAVTGFAVDPARSVVWAARHSAPGCDPADTSGCTPKRVGGGVTRWDGTLWRAWSKSRGTPLAAFGPEGDLATILVDPRRSRLYAGAWSADAAGFHWNSGVGIRTTLSSCSGDCRNDEWESTDFGADGPVRAMALDPAGRLWLGSSRERLGIVPPEAGLRVLTDTGWLTVPADRAPLPDDNITALAPTSSSMWVGSYDRGIAIWRPFEPSAYLYLPSVARLAPRP